MPYARQTQFGIAGNCWQAAIASLLDLPIEDVPDFVHVRYPPEKNDGFTPDEQGCNPYHWQDLLAWLKDRGLQIVVIDSRQLRHVTPRGVYLASGPGPRGLDHTVLMHETVMVHDPHPSDAGILEVTECAWIERERPDR